MVPGDRFCVAGFRKATPLRQGSLSGLCGLYSVMNAVQLALYPQRISRAWLQYLYIHGVRHLARRRHLSRVLGAGMAEDTWLQLAVAIVQEANRTYGSSLVVRPILNGSARTSRARALRAIRSAVTGGNPVLAGFGGALAHYTVIAGFTEERLLLFDSSGLRWVATNCVGAGERSRKRHHLFTNSVSAIVDNW
jgi:hypothetical protein